MKLSQNQLQEFDTNGYLVIPDFFDPSSLKAQARVLLDRFDPVQHQKTVFSTDDDNHVGNEYFLQSGDKIRYFLESSATADHDPQSTLNKIGHCLHELDPVFSKFSKSKEICELGASLGFKDCRILQSMLIFKQPRIGNAVPPHVDSTFL